MKPVILYPNRIPISSKSKPKEKEYNLNKESEESIIPSIYYEELLQSKSW